MRKTYWLLLLAVFSWMDPASAQHYDGQPGKASSDKQRRAAHQEPGGSKAAGQKNSISKTPLAQFNMPDSQFPPALYQLVSRQPDGACVWATLKPVRTGGEPTRVLFCHAWDVDFLGERPQDFPLVTLLPEMGTAARLLPVTVGLYVSIGDTLPTGTLTVMAMPRPSPLHVAAEHAALREVIVRAVRAGSPVVFALSDWQMIIDAAPIDRAQALQMLGMRE